MRKFIRCETDMVEGCDLKVEGMVESNYFHDDVVRLNVENYFKFK